jgi:hypothetical protein
MVLEHQTRFTNLVTRLGWESRLGRNMGHHRGGTGAVSSVRG